MRYINIHISYKINLSSLQWSKIYGKDTKDAWLSTCKWCWDFMHFLLKFIIPVYIYFDERNVNLFYFILLFDNWFLFQVYILCSRMIVNFLLKVLKFCYFVWKDYKQAFLLSFRIWPCFLNLCVFGSYLSYMYVTSFGVMYLNTFVSLPLSMQIEVLELLKRALVDDRPKSLEDCISWARHHFEGQYVNQIKQLLFNFPPDQVSI